MVENERMRFLSSVTRAHAKGVLALAACGSLVASSGYDGIIRLWTLRPSGLELLHEEEVAVDSGPIFSVELAALDRVGVTPQEMLETTGRYW